MGKQESPQLIERKTQVDTDAQETSRASKYWFLYSVSVMPENKLSLQELNQLIKVKLLTSGFFLKILVLSLNFQGWNARFSPCGRPWVWHFATQCAAVKFVKPWISSHFSSETARKILLRLSRSMPSTPKPAKALLNWTKFALTTLSPNMATNYIYKNEITIEDNLLCFIGKHYCAFHSTADCWCIIWNFYADSSMI